jgi:intraflagellar transport protein 80
MELCKTSKDCSDIQRMSQIISFSQSTVNIRRKDGGIISLSVSPYPSLLFDLCEKNGWQKAVKLCRYVKE